MLKHFAEEVRADEFAYSSYENLAKGLECKAGLLPKVAELIQKDYDKKWFEDANIRTVSEDMLLQIQKGLSPFKAELAAYITRTAEVNPIYREEIDKLSEISERSIAGVITTNYDSFLEENFSGFCKYVGQSQLIFSAIQGVAEIYKIHGSVETPDSLVINALEGKKAKLPVRILRRFKQELYEYTIINNPTGNIRVAALEDERVADDELVLSIGKASEFGLKGLRGLSSNELYRDIIIGDLHFSADELLEHAIPKLLKEKSGKLPIHKYLNAATKDFPEYQDLVRNQTFDVLISKTIKNNRNALGGYTSIAQIWENENSNLERATRLIAHLTEEQMNLQELENVLYHLFEADVNVLQNEEQNTKTNIRRLIRIYDYLKWGK